MVVSVVLQIGSGNYFWSFPSKLSMQRKRKLEDLQQRKQSCQERLTRVRQDIEKQQAGRVESVGRRVRCQSDDLLTGL